MNEKNVSQKGDFGRGLRAGLPAVLGYIPVGIAYAIAARQAGLGIWQTCSLSLFVYAGASQMMAVEMLVREAGIASIIIATFILNLRHIIMSSCIFSCMRPSKALPKVLSSFWATDESFAIFTTGEKNTAVFCWVGRRHVCLVEYKHDCGRFCNKLPAGYRDGKLRHRALRDVYRSFGSGS